VGSGRANQDPLYLPSTEIYRAPAKPGLYAWYVEPRFTVQDLEWPGDDSDAAAVWLLNETVRFSSFFAQPKVRLSGKAPFETTWRAAISVEGFGSPAPSPNHEQTVGHVLQTALSESSERLVLTEALNNAIPYFSAPCYIGVATNLNSRLNEHMNSFDRATKTLEAASQQELRDVRESGPDFGSRAVAAGLSIEELSAWILPFELEPDLTIEQLRHSLEAAEWVLNRTYRPPFGRK